jgi:putative hydrolase of the HAD superfamily
MAAILIDIGGVLAPDLWAGAAVAWGSRLGITPQAFMDAVFAGNDEQILIGRTTDDQWWTVIADRLGIDRETTAEIRLDLGRRETWDQPLLTCLRDIHDRARIALVSNAWPGTRPRLAEAGVLEIADAVLLSYELGYAKPDPRIYEAALRQVGADPAEALFIDDAPGHVAVARSLGLAGHVHTETGATIERIEAFVTRSATR